MNKNSEMIQACPTNSIMVDIGANIGVFTKEMATKASKVFAFEPEPTNIEKLREMIKDKPNVEIWPIALSNFSGFTKLMLHKNNPGGHSIHVPLDGGSWTHKLSNSIDVQVMKLDDWCEWTHIRGIAGIKIDVEAHEVEVLQGAIETLKRDRPLIALETHQVADMEALHNVLKECNYDVREKLVADHSYLFRPLTK